MERGGGKHTNKNGINRTQRGMRVKMKDGQSLETAIKYGGIQIIYNDITGDGNPEDFEKIYKCDTCGKERSAKRRINSYLAQVYRGMIHPYDPVFPYCIATFKEISTLSRHIRKRTCEDIEDDWGSIWEDIYTSNNDRYCREIA